MTLIHAISDYLRAYMQFHDALWLYMQSKDITLLFKDMKICKFQGKICKTNNMPSIVGIV